MPEIYLKDKDITLDFPDNMPLEKIKLAIKKQFYPQQEIPLPQPDLSTRIENLQTYLTSPKYKKLTESEPAPLGIPKRPTPTIPTLPGVPRERTEIGKMLAEPLYEPPERPRVELPQYKTPYFKYALKSILEASKTPAIGWAGIDELIQSGDIQKAKQVVKSEETIGERYKKAIPEPETASFMGNLAINIIREFPYLSPGEAVDINLNLLTPLVSLGIREGTIGLMKGIDKLAKSPDPIVRKASEFLLKDITKQEVIVPQAYFRNILKKGIEKGEEVYLKGGTKYTAQKMAVDTIKQETQTATEKIINEVVRKNLPVDTSFEVGFPLGEIPAIKISIPRPFFLKANEIITLLNREFSKLGITKTPKINVIEIEPIKKSEITPEPVPPVPVAKPTITDIITKERDILVKTGIPEAEITKYVRHTEADGEKLRTYTEDVIAGKITEAEAIEKVIADYEKTFIDKKMPEILGIRIEKLQELKAQAKRRAVTGLYGARARDVFLERSLKQSELTGEPTSLIAIDVDNFKAINTKYGYTEANKILKHIGEALTKEAGAEGVPINPHGDEFQIIMKGSLEQAQNKGKTIQEAVKTYLTEKGYPDVSVSIGAATRLVDGKELETIQKDAEARLKEAKEIKPVITPAPPKVEKEPWEMTRERVVWGEFIPGGASTDRALKGRVSRWEKIQKEMAADGESSEQVEGALASERARLSRAEGHRASIKQALSEGKPVPAEVLKDYPELAKEVKPEVKPAEIGLGDVVLFDGGKKIGTVKHAFGKQLRIETLDKISYKRHADNVILQRKVPIDDQIQSMLIDKQLEEDLKKRKAEPFIRTIPKWAKPAPVEVKPAEVEKVPKIEIRPAIGKIIAIDPMIVGTLPEFQVRDTPFSLERVRAILESGWDNALYDIIPVIIRAGKYIVAGDGHSRLEGYKQLKTAGKLVPDTLNFKIVTETEALRITQANRRRSNLKPLEEAKEIAKDIEKGWSLEKISDFYGYNSSVLVENLNALNNLSNEMKGLIRDNAFPLQHAFVLGRAVKDYGWSEHPEIQSELFHRFIKTQDPTPTQLKMFLDKIGNKVSEQLLLGLTGLEISKGMGGVLQDIFGKVKEITKINKPYESIKKAVDKLQKQKQSVPEGILKEYNAIKAITDKNDNEIKELLKGIKFEKPKEPPIQIGERKPFYQQDIDGKWEKVPDRIPKKKEEETLWTHLAKPTFDFSPSQAVIKPVEMKPEEKYTQSEIEFQVDQPKRPEMLVDSQIDLKLKEKKDMLMATSLTINKPEDIVDIFYELKNADRESFYITMLDRNDKVLGIHCVAMGSLTEVSIKYREVLKAPLLIKAKKIIPVHNHPSGNVAPSFNDVALTQRLREVSEPLGISVPYHIIIDHNEFGIIYDTKIKEIIDIKRRKVSGNFDILTYQEPEKRPIFVKQYDVQQSFRSGGFVSERSIKTPSNVIDIVKPFLDKKKDSFFAIYVNARNEVIAIELIGNKKIISKLGLLTKKLQENAIKNNAEGVILANNFDVYLPKELIEKLNIFGIDLLDIVNIDKNFNKNQGYRSLRVAEPEFFKEPSAEYLSPTKIIADIEKLRARIGISTERFDSIKKGVIGEIDLTKASQTDLLRLQRTLKGLRQPTKIPVKPTPEELLVEKQKKEIDAMIKVVEKEQKISLSNAEKEAIEKLHNIATPQKQNFAEKLETQMWIREIKKIQQEKNLSNITISRIKKSLGIENIKTSENPKLAELVSFINTLEKGDQFLSEKQVIALKNILSDIRQPDLIPKRIIIDKFGEKTEILPTGLTGKIINELIPTVDIKEGHPLITRIVDKGNELLFSMENRVRNRDKIIDKMLTIAEKSRKFKMKQIIVSENKEIFEAMSGQKPDLTQSERAVVAYLKNFFKKVRNDLQLEKYRKNYITHLERPLMEKIVNDGIIPAVKDIFVLKKEPDIPINIMLELDNIIGSEKFFRFALERKGGLMPTTNIRKIVHTYSQLYETKKMLDSILPEGQAITQLLLQKRSALWLKKFLQNLKGRGLDSEFRMGKMGWLSKVADGIVDIGYLKLLGLNYMSAAKNLIAGEMNAIIFQDLKKYLIGKQRFKSNPRRIIKLANNYGALEGTFYDYTQKGIGKLKKIQDLLMIGQQAGEWEIRGSIFAGELTAEEYFTGKISPERMQKINDIIAITQGKFTKIESPLVLQTWYGRMFFQMNRWRITNLMLMKRLLDGAKIEQTQGIRFGKNSRNLLIAFLLYGIGMWFSYELGKAGYKKGAKIAKSMAEMVNNVIDTFTLDWLIKSISDNPSISALKEFSYTIQELANYIAPAIVEKPKKIEFKKGIEKTYISPLERAKELLDIEQKKTTEIEIEDEEIEEEKIEEEEIVE